MTLLTLPPRVENPRPLRHGWSRSLQLIDSQTFEPVPPPAPLRSLGLNTPALVNVTPLVATILSNFAFLYSVNGPRPLSWGGAPAAAESPMAGIASLLGWRVWGGSSSRGSSS